MLQQNFDSHENQDDTAGDFCLCLEFQTEGISDFDTCEGKDKGDNTNEGNGRYNLNLQEGISDTDCKGINAGCYGEQKHSLNIDRVRSVLLFLGERFFYHVGTYQSQKDKGNPVVDCRDVALKACAQQIAEGRHQSLKAAEPESDNQRLFHGKLFHGKSLADSDGKGVHGKTDSSDKQGKKTHD